MRLFLALGIPSGVRKTLGALGAGGDLGGARWVSEEQIHLTLRFLGEVDDTAAAGLIARARERTWPPPFRVQVRGVGTFGGRTPRVLWAGIDPSGPVRELAARFEALARDAGLPPERRPFTAHVTLARLERAHPRALRDFLAAHAALASEPFEVDRAVLYRSTLTARGAIHAEHAAFPLGSA